jgi:hypothetical protein
MGLRGPHARKLKPRVRPVSWRPPYVEGVATPRLPPGRPRSLNPTIDALRMRRVREREKSGRFLIRLELPEAETIELLIEARCLDMRRDDFSREDVAAGIERFLSLARNP